MRRAALLLLLLACHGKQCSFAQNETSVDSLITVQAGELPIILSAPHGGSREIPGAEPRTGKGVYQFNRKADSGTGELAEKLANALESKLGKRPFVVIARFHRKYVDANRPSELAYESKPALKVYDAYHKALANARDEVIQLWGHGILLDIHGQRAKPLTILRGTQNGETTSHLISRFGREAFEGSTSLFGQLAKQGLSVMPKTGRSGREHPKYNGGYIVRTYGSGRGGTLDAIQLEVGSELRSPKMTSATANKIATAVADFACDYLPVAAPQPDETQPAKATAD